MPDASTSSECIPRLRTFLPGPRWFLQRTSYTCKPSRALREPGEDSRGHEGAGRPNLWGSA
eukprot:747115-Hanusia_phi.AAC.3